MGVFDWAGKTAGGAVNLAGDIAGGAVRTAGGALGGLGGAYQAYSRAVNPGLWARIEEGKKAQELEERRQKFTELMDLLPYMDPNTAPAIMRQFFEDPNNQEVIAEAMGKLKIPGTPENMREIQRTQPLPGGGQRTFMTSDPLFDWPDMPAGEGGFGLRGITGGPGKMPTGQYGPPSRSDLQAREMVRLRKKIEDGTATPEEKVTYEKLLVGQPLVEIGMQRPAASERTAIAETRASIDALNNLKKLFDDPETHTGPLVEQQTHYMGLIGGTTKAQEDLMAATFAFKNAIVKEITGANLSEAEAKRIMKQIPDINDPPKRWLAKWEQSKKNLEQLQKRRMEILKQSGIRAPTAKPAIKKAEPGKSEKTDPLGIR